LTKLSEYIAKAKTFKDSDKMSPETKRALQLLKLQNYHVEFAAGTRLPPALTHLSLQAVDCEDSEELIPPVS